MDITSAAHSSLYAEAECLRQAIIATESSTLAVEAQIKSLQSSRAFLVRNHRLPNGSSPSEPSARRQKELERQRLESLNDELAALLKSTLSNSRDASSAAAKATPKAADQYLQLNTDSLTRLQAQSTDLFHAERESPSSKASRAEDLLLALQQTLAARQQLALDRIYLQHATDDSQTSQSKTPSTTGTAHSSSTAEIDAQADEVRNDLNLLHAEVDDMSDMIVNHDHANGVRATDAAIARASSALKGVRAQKLLQNLARLVEDTEQYANVCRMLHSHRVFLERVTTLASMPAATTKAVDLLDQPSVHAAIQENALASLLRHLSLGAAQITSSETSHSSLAWEYMSTVRDASTKALDQSRSLSSTREAEAGLSSLSARTDQLIEAFEATVTQAQHIMEQERR